MVDYFTAQDGPWEETSTWVNGAVPGAGGSPDADDIVIMHNVTIGTGTVQVVGEVTAANIIIDGTSPDVGLSLDTSYWEGVWWLKLSGSITYNTSTKRYAGTVRLDGFGLDVAVPSISGNPFDSDPYSETYYDHIIRPVVQDNTDQDVIIEDPGQILTTYRLQDVTTEGNARAYTRKVGNGVRSMTVGVRVRASKPTPLAYLYDMAERGFQVLACTGRTVIKGHIETIAPDASSVGKEYISVKVTIVEGQ